jgi:hypothetical protein
LKPSPEPSPVSSGLAEEEGEVVPGVGVEGEDEDVGAVVEDRLGAVAVVVVDVEDRDALGAAVD